MSDNSRWMEEMRGQLRELSLRHILIPGTHDSGAHSFSSFPSSSPDASTAVDILTLCGKVPLGVVLGVNQIVEAWARTQGQSFKEQLEDGIRYFDLRVACDGSPSFGNMRCVHSIWAAHVSKLTAAVKEFLAHRKYEVIILDFNHFYSMDVEAYKALADGIKNDLGALLVPRQVCLKKVDGSWRIDRSRGMQDVWDSGKQVIVVFKDRNEGDGSPKIDPDTEPYNAFWPSETVYSGDFCEVGPGDDADDGQVARKKLCEKQGEWLQQAWEHHASQLYVLQGVISPSGEYITSNFLRTDGVRSRCANFVTSSHFDWLLNNWAIDQGANLTIVDFYHEHCAQTGENYLDIVRKVNWLRSHTPWGSYLQTSRNVSVVLEATCKTNNQVANRTSLQLSRDHIGDIVNDNGELKQTDTPLGGNFVDGLWKLKTDKNLGAYVPIGSYLQSSDNIRLIMSATCKSGESESSEVDSSLDITKLSATSSISNIRGVLSIDAS